MSKNKSIDDHYATILQLSVELAHLPSYHPDYDKKQEQLSRQLTSWSGKLSITIQVASNEQVPWLSEEMGYPCIHMSLKKDSNVAQTGDYVAFLDDYDMFAGLCIERKGVKRENGRMISCDLYNSFAKKDNRRRFEAEFKRYQVDSRFNRFMILVECSYLEYLSFKPAFNGKNYNRVNPGMSIESRRNTLAKLDVMGATVKFLGTRQAAVEYYRSLIIQWCRVHFKEILNLECE